VHSEAPSASSLRLNKYENLELKVHPRTFPPEEPINQMSYGSGFEVTGDHRNE